ncbi:MAG: hypothetical protein M0Z80_09585 [Treponema sp.]|nr:hypothetical protein [Treponema sp.]
MRSAAYAELDSVRREFRALVRRWSAEHSYLGPLQERLREELGYGDYRVETSIVYNEALDAVRTGDSIRVLLVADNPGKKEQLEVNRRYLVGQSGKLAAGWFERELGIDFRREVLILNKTPVHTPKTAELRQLLALAGPERGRLEALLAESQRAMADLAWRLFLAFGAGRGAGSAALWISGRGELRRGGLFSAYREELSRLVQAASSKRRGAGARSAAEPGEAPPRAWVFNHFSMNQFALEMKRKSDVAHSAWDNLERIGSDNWRGVFGQGGAA